jgi:hypothetical protein
MSTLSSGRARTLGVSVLALALAPACAGRAVPDPKHAAAEYQNALEAGDANAVYALLSDSAKRTHGLEGTKKLVRDSRAELLEVAKAVTHPDAKIEASARVRYADGEEAELTLDGERFRVAAAGTLPTGARTPSQALSELRRALSRRSYSALMRVLTDESRGALDADMRSLVDGLEQPETVDVRVRGDEAEAILPGGHKVKLRRKAGIWRVEDFD